MITNLFINRVVLNEGKRIDIYLKLSKKDIEYIRQIYIKI